MLVRLNGSDVGFTWHFNTTGILLLDTVVEYTRARSRSSKNDDMHCKLSTLQKMRAKQSTTREKLADDDVIVVVIVPWRENIAAHRLQLHDARC